VRLISKTYFIFSMMDNPNSKAKKLLETFNSYPDKVLDVRTCKQLFEEQHQEEIPLKAASCIVQRLWKKGVISRTPTQLKSGYLFTYKNKDLLKETYLKHVLPYDFEDNKRGQRICCEGIVI